jgi:hypothetical protein
MRLVRELILASFEMNDNLPKVHCWVIKDYCEAFKMAKMHTFQQRTKHVNIKYDHFREAIENGKITIQICPQTTW